MKHHLIKQFMHFDLAAGVFFAISSWVNTIFFVRLKIDGFIRIALGCNSWWQTHSINTHCLPWFRFHSNTTHKNLCLLHSQRHLKPTFFLFNFKSISNVCLSMRKKNYACLNEWLLTILQLEINLTCDRMLMIELHRVK